MGGCVETRYNHYTRNQERVGGLPPVARCGEMSDELAPYVIRDVEGIEDAVKEEKQAGKGAYGYVFKVKVGGVERIAKKLHSAYVNQVSSREKEGITTKFRAECITLSKLRHPNVVQFIGVHYGRRDKTDLTLIMELLSSDMDEFLTTRHNPPFPEAVHLAGCLIWPGLSPRV